MQPYADRKPYDTIYSADYMNPGKESLTSNRRSIARTRSTLMNPVNDTKQALCLRGSYVLTQPEINPHNLPKLERKSATSLPPISSWVFRFGSQNSSGSSHRWTAADCFWVLVAVDMTRLIARLSHNCLKNPSNISYLTTHNYSFSIDIFVTIQSLCDTKQYYTLESIFYAIYFLYSYLYFSCIQCCTSKKQ